MNKQIFKLDKLLKISIVIGIILLTSSLFYYFLLRPFSKDWSLKRCIKKAEKQYEAEKTKLNDALQILYAERSSKEDRKQELERKEKELIDKMNKEIDISKLDKELNRLVAEKKEEYLSSGTTLKTILASKEDFLKQEVRKEYYINYYKNNSTYLEIEQELSKFHNEINELNKKVDNLKKTMESEELDKKLKEGMDYCLKIY